ncbi:MAG: sigma-70 family RNA polymerase sigma factor [Oscillospiraceae bacterium]|jgi:RNA polymerase sporulation-specific sigma factor|nr:sigma-70 family RNA polymerase sigma factor [Oscillospiraceae bacterium]
MEKCLKKIRADENIGLVHLCAKRFANKGMEYEDIFQAGSLGLVKAIDKFDIGRGVKFSTYAVPVILGEIRLLFRNGGAIKVSRHLKSLSACILKERELFFVKNGREPSLTELSDILKVGVESLSEAIDSNVALLSLTASEEKGGTQLDIPVDSAEEKLAEYLSLREVIKKLEYFDKRLILLRFFKKCTQSETAKILKTNQSQVSRREKIVLAKLKRNLSLSN